MLTIVVKGWEEEGDIGWRVAELNDLEPLVGRPADRL